MRVAWVGSRIQGSGVVGDDVLLNRVRVVGERGLYTFKGGLGPSGCEFHFSGHLGALPLLPLQLSDPASGKSCKSILLGMQGGGVRPPLLLLPRSRRPDSGQAAVRRSV